MNVDDEPLPESCVECGACCFGDGERYLRLSGDDHARLGEAGASVTRFIGNRCYVRLVDGHCAALVVTRDAPRFVCSVYGDRPGTCRTLERGSPECRAELARKRARAVAASAESVE